MQNLIAALRTASTILSCLATAADASDSAFNVDTVHLINVCIIKYHHYYY